MDMTRNRVAALALTSVLLLTVVACGLPGGGGGPDTDCSGADVGDQVDTAADAALADTLISCNNSPESPIFDIDSFLIPWDEPAGTHVGIDCTEVEGTGGSTVSLYTVTDGVATSVPPTDVECTDAAEDEIVKEIFGNPDSIMVVVFQPATMQRTTVDLSLAI